MIPVNLEYSTWFPIIYPTNNSETKLISLHDHLLHKPWFLCIKLVARNKCLIVTTQSNLPKACTWIDKNLELMVWKSIPSGIDLPSSLLPCRLNKPVYMAMSHSYADILKKQFSLALTPMTPATANNQPPHKWQATIIDYDLDQLADSPLSTTVISNSISHPCHSTPPTAMTTNANYAMELLSIKTEITLLKTIITTAVEQIKNTIASLNATHHIPMSSNIDTDVENLIEPHNLNQTPLNLPTFIKDLKHDIATIVHESFKQQLTPTLNINPQYSSVT